jgi:CDP-diglyceride synthetase
VTHTAGHAASPAAAKFISGLTLFAATAALGLLAAPLYWRLVIVLTIMAAGYECARLLGRAGAVGVLLGMALGVALLLMPHAGARLASARVQWYLTAVACAFALALRARHAEVPQRPKRNMHQTMAGAAGALLSCGLLAAIALRELPGGPWLVTLVVLAAWSGDMGAGVLTQRFVPTPTPIWVWASPRKNWEGVAFGALSSAAAVALAVLVFRMPVLTSTVTRLVVVACLCRPLGDLLESAIKRLADARDSSRFRLLPGHGGVFDRIDSLTLAFPVTYLVVPDVG